MSKYEIRRLRDKKRTADRLRDKFIAKYIEGLHGDIYVEAQELYEEARRKNPLRKDLTKTIEFMNAVMPDKPVPAYYYVRPEKQSRKPRKTTATLTSDMVLNIPLIPMTSNTLPPVLTSSDVEIPPVSATSDPEIAPVSTTSDVEIPPVSSTSDVEIAPVLTTSDVEIPPVLTTSDVEIAQPQLEIPSSAYTQLLQELAQDPELSQIFNDIGETGDNLDEGINDTWDSYQDQTPLERELSRIGY